MTAQPLDRLVSFVEKLVTREDDEAHAQVKPRFKRRKNRMDNDHTNAVLIQLDLNTLRKHFVLPLGLAAKKIAVCRTALKSACRKIGLVGWPYRKLRAVDRRLAALTAQRKDVSSRTDKKDEHKKNEHLIEVLLELKCQLMEGKQCGKIFAKKRNNDESESEQHSGIEELLGLSLGSLEEVYLDDSSFPPQSPATSPHKIVLLPDDIRTTSFPSAPEGSFPYFLPSSCSSCTAPRDNRQEALNDILRSGENPYALEFLGLNCSEGIHPDSSAHTVLELQSYAPPSSEQFSGDLANNFTAAGPGNCYEGPVCGAGMLRDASGSWTVLDELKSLQGLVRLLFKEQAELSKELHLSQARLRTEEEQVAELDQTLASLRRQLAVDAGGMVAW